MSNKTHGSGTPRRGEAVLDLLSGLTAILVVVTASIHSPRIGLDSRGLFGVSAACFFVAAFFRGGAKGSSTLKKSLLISSAGMLGNAALIINDGLHRLEIPIALSVTCWLTCFTTIYIRKLWKDSPSRSAMMMLAFAAIMTAFVMFLAPQVARRASQKTTYQTAPQFTFTNPGGGTVTSSQLRGRVIVLAFWATWCAPCGDELVELQHVYTRYSTNSGVSIMAVDVAWRGDTAKKARDFLTRRKITLRGVFDSGAAMEAFGVDALPVIVVIDRLGNIRMLHYGYDKSERLDDGLAKQIDALL